ncbi:MAG: hypothetical protein AAGG72_08860 [Pseudomonadota bacterium]
MNILRATLMAALLAFMGPIGIHQASAAAVSGDLPTLSDPVGALTGGTVVTDTGLAQSRLASEQETVQVAGRRLRGLAAGLIVGATAAAIVAGSARAHKRRRYHRHHRHYNRCERWYDRCEYGGRRKACRKFYRYCD